MKTVKVYFTNGYEDADVVQFYNFADIMTDAEVAEVIEHDFYEYCEAFAHYGFGFPWKELADGHFNDEKDMLNAESDYYDNCHFTWEYVEAEADSFFSIVDRVFFEEEPAHEQSIED